MSGLYTDHNRHFQEYKDSDIKKVMKYAKQSNKKLKYDLKTMVKMAGKANFRLSHMDNVIYEQNSGQKEFTFYVDSTVLGMVISLQNRNRSHNATVKLYDPNGDLVVHDYDANVSVKDGVADTVITVKFPIYGKWHMVFDKGSDFTGRIKGYTPLKLYGFSFVTTVMGRHGPMYSETKTIKPVIGSLSKVVLFGEKLYDAQSLKVAFVDNVTTKRIDAKVKGVLDSNTVYIERSNPDMKYIYVEIQGKDINGFTFRRRTLRPFINN